MSYMVRFVNDGDLPVGHDWAMVRERGDFVLFVKRTRVTSDLMEQAWAAYRQLSASRLMIA